MKKILISLASAAALCGSSMAQADTWSPSGNWQMSGPVTFSKGLTVNCTMTIDISVASTGSMATGSPQYVGFFCPLFMEGPYLTELQPDGTTLTLHDVVMIATLGSGGCSGDLSGQWDNVAKTLTIDTIVPTDTPGTYDCTVHAVLTLNSPSGGSIVP